METLVSIAVISTLITLIAPSFSETIQNDRLRKATDAFITQIKWSQNHSAQTGTDLQLSFRVNGPAWCFGVTDAQTCDCTVAQSCTVAGQEQVTSSATYPGVLLAPPAQPFAFTALKKTVTGGEVSFINDEGKQLKVVVSGLGRVRHCSPDGAAHLTSAPSCS